jgi:hypothetical protein
MRKIGCVCDESSRATWCLRRVCAKDVSLVGLLGCLPPPPCTRQRQHQFRDTDTRSAQVLDRRKIMSSCVFAKFHADVISHQPAFYQAKSVGIRECVWACACACAGRNWCWAWARAAFEKPSTTASLLGWANDRDRSLTCLSTSGHKTFGRVFNMYLGLILVPTRHTTTKYLSYKNTTPHPTTPSTDTQPAIDRPASTKDCTHVNHTERLAYAHRAHGQKTTSTHSFTPLTHTTSSLRVSLDRQPANTLKYFVSTLINNRVNQASQAAAEHSITCTQTRRGDTPKPNLRPKLCKHILDPLCRARFPCPIALHSRRTQTN